VPKAKRRKPAAPDTLVWAAPGVYALRYLARTHYRPVDREVRPVAKLLHEAGLRPFSRAQH